MELTQIQKEIIESKEDKVVVISAAGSGKTTCLVERLRYLIKSGVNPKDIVCITFTKNAADTIKERVPESTDAFIGTIHSYANKQLIAEGVDTRVAIANEDFDLLFELVEEHLPYIRPIKYLLLDEAQDCNRNQFYYMFTMLDPESFFVIGDFKQCIYGFNGSNPDLLLNLSKNPEVACYYLEDNFRNGRKILDFAKEIINYNTKYVDDSVTKSKEIGEVKIFRYFTDAILLNELKLKNDYGKWFILARSNAAVCDIMKTLTEAGIPNVTFKQSKNNNDELNKLINSDAVKVLTIHSAKGLESDYVMVTGITRPNKEEYRLAYVGATRARKLLIWAGNKL